MKSKLVIINTLLIGINLLVTIRLLGLSTLEYASYSEYILMSSYIGIFSLGLNEGFQRKVSSRTANYHKNDLFKIFTSLNIVNIITFVLLFNLVQLKSSYIIVIIVYSNYYLSKSLLSIAQKFTEVKLYEIIERIIFLIIIIIVKDIETIILCDISLKIIFSIICTIRTYFCVNGDKLSYTPADFIYGAMIMSGNWLLIVALNMDKEVMLNVGQNEFGIYSIALSIFLVLNNLVLPLRIYYFANSDIDPTKLLNKISIMIAIVAVVGVDILIRFELFPRISDSLEILKNIIWILPIYIQININIINQMQIKKPLQFAIANVVVVSIGYLSIRLLNYSMFNVIIFKFFIIILLYIGYMKILKKTGIIEMILISLGLLLFQTTYLSIIILIPALILYRNNNQKVQVV